MKPTLLLLPLLCAASLRADEVWTGTSDVKFHGDSTLHGFDGTVKNVPLTVKMRGEPGSRTVTATSDVTVKDMDTDDDSRDANMMKMFRQTEFPLIKVEVPKAEEGKLRPAGGKPGAMTVKLTIAGKSRNIDAAVTNLKEAPKDLSFDLAFPVSLAAHELPAPSVLGGLVKVADKVDVTVHVTLKKKS